MVFLPGICRLLSCCLLLPAGTDVAPSAETAQRPYRGDRLGYISAGKMYVGFPRVHVVPGPGNAFQPVISFDGR